MFDFTEYIVEPEHAGLSIKEYLRNIRDVSGRNLQKLTRAKGIYLNGRRTILDKKLKYKDSLKILILQERLNIIPEKGVSIEVLYEDEKLLVINKPAGMLVHPAGQTTNSTVINYLADTYRTNKNVHLHALHRLDRDTSGCVLFAKNAQAKQELETAMREGKIKRVYQALVCGHLSTEAGRIVARIDKDPFFANRRIVNECGQEAITEYKLLQSLDEQLHLLELNLLTGRTHQIRVHLAYIGLPILGDGMYGVRKFNTKRQLLHAVKICFSDIDGMIDKEILAPIPADIQLFIKE